MLQRSVRSPGLWGLALAATGCIGVAPPEAARAAVETVEGRALLVGLELEGERFVRAFTLRSLEAGEEVPFPEGAPAFRVIVEDSGARWRWEAELARPSDLGTGADEAGAVVFAVPAPPSGTAVLRLAWLDREEETVLPLPALVDESASASIPRHIAGDPDPEGRVLVALAPSQWGPDREAFAPEAFRLATALLREDFFRDHPQDFSFWMVPDWEGLDAIDSSGNWVLVALRARLAARGLRFGRSRRSPDALVLVAPSDQGSWGTILPLGVAKVERGGSGGLFAHELGHSFGGLADEFGGMQPRDCGRKNHPVSIGAPNVAFTYYSPWTCIAAGGSWERACPSGEPLGEWVGAWQECSDYVHPCRLCKMLHQDYETFCPVCRGVLEAVLRQRTGGAVVEQVATTLAPEVWCNGVDDDLDGRIDEGCDCPRPPRPE